MNYSIKYLEPTQERVEELSEILKDMGIKLKVKLWLNEKARGMGDPNCFALNNPYDFSLAVAEPEVEYEEGGCLEIVVDDDDELCIYHTEASETYICAYNLEELGIEVEENPSDIEFNRVIENM